MMQIMQIIMIVVTWRVFYDPAKRRGFEMNNKSSEGRWIGFCIGVVATAIVVLFIVAMVGGC